ncbi:MAG: HAD family hydrolase [Bacteroidota bacterium]
MTKSKKIIVFDLDETLIHATKSKLDINEDFRYQDFYVYKRPNLATFLEGCSKFCSIAIWSSADDEYVNNLVNKIAPKSVDFEFVWGRSECWMKVVSIEEPETGLKRKEYQNIKPLEKVRRKGFKMNNLLIIDDSHYKVKDNPENFFIIQPFEGNQEDNELISLLAYLKVVIEQDDFVGIKREHWKEIASTRKPK